MHLRAGPDCCTCLGWHSSTSAGVGCPMGCTCLCSFCLRQCFIISCHVIAIALSGMPDYHLCCLHAVCISFRLMCHAADICGAVANLFTRLTGSKLVFVHDCAAAAVLAQIPEPNCNSNKYEGAEVWSSVVNYIGPGAGAFWWV